MLIICLNWLCIIVPNIWILYICRSRTVFFVCQLFFHSWNLSKFAADILLPKQIVRRSEGHDPVAKVVGNKCIKGISHHWDILSNFRHVPLGLQAKVWCSSLGHSIALEFAYVSIVKFGRWFVTLRFSFNLNRYSLPLYKGFLVFWVNFTLFLKVNFTFVRANFLHKRLPSSKLSFFILHLTSTLSADFHSPLVPFLH